MLNYCQFKKQVGIKAIVYASSMLSKAHIKSNPHMKCESSKNREHNEISLLSLRKYFYSITTLAPAAHTYK